MFHLFEYPWPWQTLNCIDLYSLHDIMRLENLKSMGIRNIRKIICKLLRSRIIKLFFAYFCYYFAHNIRKKIIILKI